MQVFVRRDEDEDDELLKPALPVASDDEDIDLDAPPATGEEFLRRVRLEASQIANVARAHIDPSRILKPVSLVEREVVPPTRKEILPFRSWRNNFVAEFVELRLSFLRCKATRNFSQTSQKLKPLPAARDFKSWEGVWSGPNQAPPLISTLARLSVPSVNTLLIHIVEWDENELLPGKNQIEWIFSLMVSVEKPLDSSVAAAMRGLLKRCYAARSKMTPNSTNHIQLAILNIFIVLAGVFFGQASPEFVVDFDDTGG